MPVNGISNGDNPFKMPYDFNLDGDSKVQGADDAHGIKKAGGANQGADFGANPEAKIDKGQFTNENDIQEIDPDQFIDDM